MRLFECKVPFKDLLAAYASSEDRWHDSHIYSSGIANQPHSDEPREHFSYRPTVQPCGLDRELGQLAEWQVRVLSTAFYFGRALPRDNKAIGP